ncbi:MAG: hypothetical protein EOP06_01635 [Proteobacteria bacterium]|nr:MAG: hypothetical protein EOP06_01635 [Pseudomonadota bacterium]
MVNIDATRSVPHEPGSDSVHTRLVTHVSDLQDALALLSAKSIAQQCALQALIATHPNPRALLDTYVLQAKPAHELQTPNVKMLFTKEILQFHERIQGAIDLLSK